MPLCTCLELPSLCSAFARIHRTCTGNYLMQPDRLYREDQYCTLNDQNCQGCKRRFLREGFLSLYHLKIWSSLFTCLGFLMFQYLFSTSRNRKKVNPLHRQNGVGKNCSNCSDCSAFQKLTSSNPSRSRVRNPLRAIRPPPEQSEPTPFPWTKFLVLLEINSVKRTFFAKFAGVLRGNTTRGNTTRNSERKMAL